MRQVIIIFCLSLLAVGTQGQTDTTVWTLEDCVDYAQENNINLAISYLDQRTANTEAKRSRHSRWPSLSASSNFGYNFGRTIDPTSNEFITTSLGFNSISLNSGLTLFNYNRINNSIRQAV